MAPASSRRKSITVSLVIAIILVVGAYVLSGHGFPSFSTPANAETSEALLKAYAAKDTDGDGLPDWEEALYGTDPNNAHSVRADLTDAQAVAQGLVTPQYQAAPASDASSTDDLAASIPGNTPAANSVTAQFSQLFFSSYLSTRGSTPPSADQLQSFVEDAVTQLEQTQSRPDAYTASDLKVAGNGADAMRTYAEAVQAAFAQDGPKTPYGEVAYFSDAVEKNDTTAIANLNTIAAGYASLAKALSQVPVPTEAATAHLAFVNSLAHLGDSVAGLASVQQDPIRGMLALGTYPKDADSFKAALGMLGDVFNTDDATLSQDDPGYSFFYAATAMIATTTTP